MSENLRGRQEVIDEIAERLDLPFLFTNSITIFVPLDNDNKKMLRLRTTIEDVAESDALAEKYVKKERSDDEPI